MVSRKTFFTTGEAAELLQLSKSTVARKFDRGLFRGIKNSITGERSISRESLEAFMTRYGLSLEKLRDSSRNLFLVTADVSLQGAFQQVFAKDEGIELKQVAYGSDTIFWCSKQAPDLLILDGRIADMPCAEVVKSLRRMKELQDLKIICYAKQHAAEDCSEQQCGIDGSLSDNVFDEAYLKGKVHTFLYPSKPITPAAMPGLDRRQWPRIRVSFPLDIEVYCTNSPDSRELGTAVLEDVSCGGAHLSQIRTRNGFIPCDPFRFLVRAHQPLLRNWQADCRVVRLQSNGSVRAGLEFHQISRPNLKKIERLLKPTREVVSTRQG
jgi:CheY-like chemotaxis protein